MNRSLTVLTACYLVPVLDMTGVIGLLVFVLVLVAIAIAVLIDSQLIVAFFLQKIIEPFVRWSQRVFFGIDRVRAGTETLIGAKAIAVKFEKSDDGQFVGSVVAEGENWSACSKVPIQEGTAVSIVDREDLKLIIRPSRNE